MECFLHDKIFAHRKVLSADAFNYDYCLIRAVYVNEIRIVDIGTEVICLCMETK